MTVPWFIVVLLCVVSLVALETVIYWHRHTRGTWREWPAGRSLMYLLLIIAFGFGFGALNQFLGQYPARPFVGVGLYGLFISALLVIRFTIRAEMKRGTSPLRTVLPLEGACRPVIVATENEETEEARP